MLEQFGMEGLGNALTFSSQDSGDMRSLEQWAPERVFEARMMHSELLFSVLLLTFGLLSPPPPPTHTQCASVTLGHRCACPSSNFVRTLFTRLATSGHNVDFITWEDAIDDLTTTVHHDVCEISTECDKDASLRAFLSVMKRLPVEVPLDVVGKYEFDRLLAKMGKRGVKRPIAEGDHDDLEAQSQREMPAKVRQRSQKHSFLQTAEGVQNSSDAKRFSQRVVENSCI